MIVRDFVVENAEPRADAVHQGEAGDAVLRRHHLEASGEQRATARTASWLTLDKSRMLTCPERLSSGPADCDHAR